MSWRRRPTQKAFPVQAIGGSLRGKKMNERHQDCKLLRAFARQDDQPEE
jgi:hypothetical protein